MAADGGARLTVWWLGEGRFDDRLLAGAREGLASQYGGEVELLDPGERPAGTFDAARGQHSSRAFLHWLSAREPDVHGRILGVTDVDLFIPILTFVFGEAQLDGRAAVVSSARLRHEDARVTAARLAREAVHEVGHTFGLRHCDGLEGAGRRAQPCVMARSPSVRAVDAKSPRLCADCRARYRLLVQQEGTHVYREHQNPGR
jgi:archaemetzincin